MLGEAEIIASQILFQRYLLKKMPWLTITGFCQNLNIPTMSVMAGSSCLIIVFLTLVLFSKERILVAMILMF